jgi:hypothetical protein
MVATPSSARREASDGRSLPAGVALGRGSGVWLAAGSGDGNAGVSLSDESFAIRAGLSWKDIHATYRRLREHL